MGALGALILVAACVFGIPWIREMLNTVSTDDDGQVGPAQLTEERVQVPARLT